MNFSASDLKLLQALQENINMSQIDLAERAGLSRTSVWRRVRELEEQGVIDRRVALLNPRKLGLQIHVLLSVTMVQHSDRIRQAFEEHVALSRGLPGPGLDGRQGRDLRGLLPIE